MMLISNTQLERERYHNTLIYAIQYTDNHMYNNTPLVHYCVKQNTYDVCNMITRTLVGL